MAKATNAFASQGKAIDGTYTFLTFAHMGKRDRDEDKNDVYCIRVIVD